MEVKKQLFVFLCVVLCVNCVSIFKRNADLNDPSCGVEASPAPIHRNPWLVLLEYYKNGYKESIRCAGALIGRRHVVTAAHCIKIATFDKLVVRLGEYDLRTEVDCADSVCASAPITRTVLRALVPGTYDGSEDDIALLELDHDVPYNDFIRPVCLPSRKLVDATFTASGWGEFASNHTYSHIKKLIALPGWTDNDCRKAYKNLKLPKKIICAGGEEGKDTCRGDSGGPLVYKRERVELHGVTSSGNVYCGTKGSPGIYTSMVDHLDWIDQVIKKKRK